MRRLLRLCLLIFVSYWVGCILMVATTPRAQPETPRQIDCHGETLQACMRDVLRFRSAAQANPVAREPAPY